MTAETTETYLPINLTPHMITVLDGSTPDTYDGPLHPSAVLHPAHKLPRALPVPRIEMTSAGHRPAFFLPDGWVDGPADVPSRTMRLGQVVDLPPVEAGAVWIVSLPTAVAVIAAGMDEYRGHIAVVGREVRTSEGRIVGCRSIDLLDW